MSRPILERLGFTIVGWEDCLLDRFDEPPARREPKATSDSPDSLTQ